MQDYSAIGISILTAVLVLVMIRHGYTEKLFAALALFLRLAVSFTLAMTFYRFLSSLIVRNVPAISEYMAIRVTFLAIMWGFYVLTTELYERWMQPEHVQVHKIADRVGGIIFGGLAGALLVGMLLFSLASVPIARVYRPMPIEKSGLPVDMGKVLIEQYAHLSKQIGEPGSFDAGAEIAAYLGRDAEEFKPPRRAARPAPPPKQAAPETKSSSAPSPKQAAPETKSAPALPQPGK